MAAAGTRRRLLARSRAPGAGTRRGALTRARTPLAIAAGALLLRLLAGVGFANYDTLYALAWGGQLSRGQVPAYDVPIAPTPHPLVEVIGVILSPLGPRGVIDVTVALGFLALAACGWVIYRLGAEWFGRLAGALAALVFLTRVPVLSYGVRAYVDVPYVLFVLGALAVESRARREHRSPAGTRVLALLALAGLLRPEAWAFSGIYWLYATGLGETALRRWAPAAVRSRLPAPATGESALPTRRRLLELTLLAAAAPIVWIASDLAITGRPLWSLTNTRHTASTLHRVTGIANVPEYVPRRIGEILRPPVLAGAAIGGVLSLLWLRRRALPGALAGVLAVIVFILFASFGLPINTRYAFLAAAILAVFCGAGVFGWMALDRAERARRRGWAIAGGAVIVALLAYAPSQYKGADHELGELRRQQHIEAQLVALVRQGAVNLRCGPVGVPNHAPVPLLALYLKTSPRNIVNAQVGGIASGVYVDPASSYVERTYVLDRHDPVRPVTVPPGFTESRANPSWLIFQRCS